MAFTLLMVLLTTACNKENQNQGIQGSWVLTAAVQMPGELDLFAANIYNSCEKNATMHTFGRNSQYSYTDGCTKVTTGGTYFYNQQQQTVSVTRENNPNVPILYKVASLSATSMVVEQNMGSSTYRLSFRRQ
jgi:hypothetical protein